MPSRRGTAGSPVPPSASDPDEPELPPMLPEKPPLMVPEEPPPVLPDCPPLVVRAGSRCGERDSPPQAERSAAKATEPPKNVRASCGRPNAMSTTSRERSTQLAAASVGEVSQNSRGGVAQGAVRRFCLPIQTGVQSER